MKVGTRKAGCQLCGRWCRLQQALLCWFFKGMQQITVCSSVARWSSPPLQAIETAVAKWKNGSAKGPLGSEMGLPLDTWVVIQFGLWSNLGLAVSASGFEGSVCIKLEMIWIWIVDCWIVLHGLKPPTVFFLAATWDLLCLLILGWKRCASGCFSQITGDC